MLTVKIRRVLSSIPEIVFDRSSCPDVVSVEDVELLVILHRARRLLDVEVRFSPSNELEKLVADYLTVQSGQTGELRRRLREIVPRDSLLALMLRLVPWDDAYRLLMMHLSEVLRRGSLVEHVKLAWALARYHLHKYSSLLIRKILREHVRDLRLVLVCLILFGVLDLDVIPFGMTKLKIHDFLSYGTWLIMHAEKERTQDLCVLFQSCGRAYLLAGPDIVSEEARMSTYPVKIVTLADTLHVVQERDRKIVIMASREGEVRKYHVRGENIVMKCVDVDAKFTRLDTDIVVADGDLCIVAGRDVDVTDETSQQLSK